MCSLLPITRKSKPQLFDFSQGIDGIELCTPSIFQDCSYSVIYGADVWTSLLLLNNYCSCM